MRREGDELNDVIGRILRYGTVLSAVVIGAGVILVVLAPPQGTPPSIQAVVSGSFGRPTLDPSALLAGLGKANPLSVLELGTLVLLATPFARVGASVLLFLRERDRLYVGITLLVLCMLLFAVFVLGPSEA